MASWQVRKGLLCRDRLRGIRFELDDFELLAGRIAPDTDCAGNRDEARKYLATYTWPGGQTGHCELDLSGVFASGIAGVRSRVRDLAAKCAGQQHDTYESFATALDGLEAMILSAADTAQAAMAGAAPDRQAELREVADACRRIAASPPQTFRDAIQLLWFCDLAVMVADMTWLVVPGHIDRTLGPFYEADLAAGRITRDHALLLIESLYLLINESIADGLAMSVMVGGRDVRGA